MHGYLDSFNLDKSNINKILMVILNGDGMLGVGYGMVG